MQKVNGKRKWIYALQPKGKHYTRRSLLSIVYLALFFTLPFVRIKGMPFIQLNIPEATFILFGNIFLPQDFLFLGIAMICFILFIILFTISYGRVFCGWICPQTIFMEMVFRKIEYWIEGPANRQAVHNKKQWSTELWLRKIAKHLIFLLVAFIIAHTFLAYIIGTEALWQIITGPFYSHIGGFLALCLFTLVFYFVYTFLREIVCTVVCPYGRLQGVLLNEHSLVVAYDFVRGEPRSRRKRNENIDAGDCIDCGLCVQVCPTGIDIRNGTQMECIHCTACIDACNLMMRRAGRQPDLVKMCSSNSLQPAAAQKKVFSKKVYAAVMLLLVGIFVFVVFSRSSIDATVLRVPGQVLQEHPDGTVSNLYRIKLVNKSNMVQPYHLSIENSPAKIEYVGKPLNSLLPGVVAEETFFVKVPAGDIHKRKEHYTITIRGKEGTIINKEIIFIGQY